MKTIVTPFVFMCALMLLGTPALGQITITTADLTAQLAVGDSLPYKIDTATSHLDIGVKGLTAWDFSSLRSDSSLSLYSVVVSGTPFNAQFPGATHAYKTNFTYLFSGLLIPVTAYVYFQISGNLLNLGEGVNGSLGTIPGSALVSNIPAEVFYSLPMTLGTTWSSAYLDTSVFTLQGIGVVQTSGVSHRTSYVVDAYGPMTIPGGTVHDALRIKENDTTSKGIYVDYIFLARDGASVQVTAANTSQPESGIIQIVQSANWNLQVVASPLPIQLASFNASQNTSGAGVLLRWSTLSEVNNYGFEVQRGERSDGDFATVSGALIPGHGTTTVPRDYSYADISAPAGTWYYRLEQIDLDGAVRYSDPAKVDVRAGGAGQDVPAVFSLGQNFPNPFNPVTTIRYGLPARSQVELAVFNMLGERIAVLAEGEQEGGYHEVRFDGSSLASGVYFYRLRSAGFVQTKKLSLLK